jgi:predicted RNA-binding Zn-ribbon protein involved in translation (DUF1610 family)
MALKLCPLCGQVMKKYTALLLPAIWECPACGYEKERRLQEARDRRAPAKGK